MKMTFYQLAEVSTALFKLQQYNRQLQYKLRSWCSVAVASVPLIEAEKERQLNNYLYQVHYKFH